MYCCVRADAAETEEEGSLNDPCVTEDVDSSETEQKLVGGLAWSVYRTYWRSVGGALATAVLLSLFLMQGSHAS